MTILLSSLLLALAILASVPAMIFFIEVIAAIKVPQPLLSALHLTAERPQVAVLIPAHNEENGIASIIKNVKLQLRTTDRLLVVADNCTDDTAKIAASLEVEVIQRNDAARIGKGYALDWGIQYLKCAPPEVLIVVDADCHFSEGSIDALASTCETEKRPVQSLNLMKPPPELPEGFEFAAFAWKVKNWIRPLGLRALRLPCQLTGTGMAFPWQTIQSADLATGEIVEDLKLGLELAKAGFAPVFCPASRVTSYFPVSKEGATTQRERWERGHLHTIVRVAPRLIGTAVMQNNLNLFALALDVSVPPVVLLAIFQITLLTITSAALSLGLSSIPFYTALLSFLALASAILLCWLHFGDGIPLRKLALAPVMLAQKLGLYRRILSRDRPKHWIRTDREKTAPPKGNSHERTSL